MAAGLAGGLHHAWHRVANGRAGDVILMVDLGVVVIAAEVAILLCLVRSLPSRERSAIERLDVTRGQAAEELFDAEAAGPLSGEAMRAAVTLRHALAERPVYEASDNASGIDLVFRDTAIDAEVSAALARYRGLAAPRTASLATSTPGDAPSVRRDWVAMHRTGDRNAHDGGGINEIYNDWYIAHRSSVPGRAIYDLRVGDELTVDGNGLVVVGEDYGHVGEPCSWVRDRNPDAVLLQTCLDTGGIAGDPVVYKVCRRVDARSPDGVVAYR